MAIIKSQFTLRLDLIDHAKIKKISEEEKFDTKLTLPLVVRRRTPFFMLYRE